MRPVRYSVAASLDGYIAGPNGEFDWIPEDPTVDFAALFARVDTVLVGRVSYELVLDMGAAPWKADTRVYVFSRTLEPSDHPDVTLVANDAGRVVADLRTESGEGEIWLFGGGVLFRSLILEGQVDVVEVTVVPILLGGGIPLLAPGQMRLPLSFTGTHAYPSGMVTLTYLAGSTLVSRGRSFGKASS